MHKNEQSERLTKISYKDAFRFYCERCRLTSYLNKTSGRVKENVLTQSISVVRTRGADNPIRWRNVVEKATALQTRLMRGAEDEIKKAAFTLAEVLITLGIIGVIAAMTMPELIQNSKEKETVVKLKKAYSALSQAVLFVSNEYGPIENWGLTQTNTGEVDDEGNRVYDFSGPDKMAALLEPYLRVSGKCLNTKKCDFVKKSYDINGNILASSINGAGSRAMLMLNDGIVFWFGYTTPYNADILVAFPDKKGNIKYGVNSFYFDIKDNKVYPRGTDQSSFESQCLGGFGGHCGGWIIVNENMDYLHCKDLSFDDKTKCK